MEKKVVNINEKELKSMVVECVAKILKEGSTNSKVLEAWDEMTEQVGAQAMLDMVYSALSHDQLVSIIKYFNRVYEFGIDMDNIY